jgi:hypothetical protein
MFKLQLVVLLSIPYFAFSQNSAVTAFTEKHDTALTLYFYPSTLRMINLERNQEFDEMIRHVKKARFFRMDSGSVTKEDLQILITKLSEDGFEEMMMIKNQEMDLSIWGLDQRIPETIVISKNDHEVMLLEVEGMINVAKIPKIMDSFNENAFLNVLDLNGKTANAQRSQNQ